MVTATTLIEVAIDGLAQGMFLTLLGVGITLVFGLGEVLNLAIGSFAIGAVLIAITGVNAGLGVVTAGVLAVLAVGVFSLVIDKTLLEQVYKSEGEQRILLGIFVTLGLAEVLTGTLNNLYPSRYSLPVSLPGIDIGGISIVGSSVFVIIVSAIILVILFVFLRKTFLGKATRTVFQDEEGALLVGVNPRRIRTLIFVLSSVIAAIAGLTSAIGSGISATDSFRFTVFALIVAIVGGVRSLEGAVAAGIILGIITTYANFFIGSYVAALILFATAIVVLLFNPEVIRG